MCDRLGSNASESENRKPDAGSHMEDPDYSKHDQFEYRLDQHLYNRARYRYQEVGQIPDPRC
jgi:hypothetical protein